MFDKIIKMVGFRGTKVDIESYIESIISREKAFMDKSIRLCLFDEDNSIDIGYQFTIDNKYDFDIFVIETRQKSDEGEPILYVTEVTEND